MNVLWVRVIDLVSSVQMVNVIQNCVCTNVIKFFIVTIGLNR